MPNNKVLWVSREHKPTRSQLGELKRIYGGDVRVVPYKETFDSAEEIVRRYEEERCIALVFVGPDSALRRLVELPNVVVVRAIKRKAGLGESPDHVDKRTGRASVFEGFERVDSYTFQTTRL